MGGERKESKDCSAYRDQDGSEADDPCIKQCFFERLAFFVHLLDEVKQHDDVADDDADEAGDPEEGHKPERRSHQVKGNECADDAIRSGSEDQEWFDGVTELESQREENEGNGNQHDESEILKALLLLCLFAADNDAITGWKGFAEFLDFGPGGGEDLGGECTGDGKALNRNRTEVLEVANAQPLENVFN